MNDIVRKPAPAGNRREYKRVYVHKCIIVNVSKAHLAFTVFALMNRREAA